MSGMIALDSAPYTPAEMHLAGQIGEALNKHYPGHLWAVNVDNVGGVVNIFNMRLSGRWGFTLHLNDVLHDPDLKTVMRAGGELLERYRLKVGRFNQDQYDSLPADFAGNFVAEQ